MVISFLQERNLKNGGWQELVQRLKTKLSKVHLLSLLTNLSGKQIGFIFNVYIAIFIEEYIASRC